MKLMTVFLLLFSHSVLSQDNLFETYLSQIKSGDITKSNSIYYLEQSEKKFFQEVTTLADELKFNESDINFISAKDNFSKTLGNWEPVSYTHLTLPTTPYV